MHNRVATIRSHPIPEVIMRMRIPSTRAAVAAGVLACMLGCGPGLAATSDAATTVPFKNGGVTKDEADAMRAQAAHYPLEVTLARRGETPGRNEFVAEASLRIVDGAGHVILERDGSGPIFLATLPDGNYTVDATYDGKRKTQRVQIKDAHHVAVTFLWE